MKTITLGTELTFMAATRLMAIRQKTGNHCFVACVASALLDEGYDKLQDLIVDKFQTELRKDSPDKSGAPKEFTDVEAVLKGLNLAVSVTRDLRPAQEAKHFLMDNRHMASRIFIETTPQGTHCVRLCEVRDDGVTVMEPNDGDFHPWTWAEFEKEHHALVLLHW
jgi:hypothetical protein